MKRKSGKNPTEKRGQKRKINKTILIRCGCAAGVLLLIAALLFFIPRKNAWFSLDCFRARAAVSWFLKNVEAKEFKDAAEYVSFSSVDGEDLPSDEENRNAWISRITDLTDGKDRRAMIGYSKLSVVKVKGEIQVKVVLDVTYQGAKDTFAGGEREVFLVKREGDWKIASVSEYGYEKMSQYEKALSGILPDGE